MVFAAKGTAREDLRMRCPGRSWIELLAGSFNRAWHGARLPQFTNRQCRMIDDAHMGSSNKSIKIDYVMPVIFGSDLARR